MRKQKHTPTLLFLIVKGVRCKQSHIVDSGSKNNFPDRPGEQLPGCVRRSAPDVYTRRGGKTHREARAKIIIFIYISVCVRAPQFHH